MHIESRLSLFCLAIVFQTLNSELTIPSSSIPWHARPRAALQQHLSLYLPHCSIPTHPDSIHASLCRMQIIADLNICSVNSWSPVLLPPSLSQPSWQETVDLFHSPFPWQLSVRDQRGFTGRQSAAVESLLTARLKLWYLLACITVSPHSPMSI